MATPTTTTTANDRLRVRFQIVQFEDMTAGSTRSLPEENLRVHMFLSEHLESADQRNVVVVRLPSDLRSVVDLKPTIAPNVSSSSPLSPSAGIGFGMFAVSQDAGDGTRMRRFLVPVGTAFLPLTTLVDRHRNSVVFDVELNDYCDRGAPGARTLKGRLHLRCVALGDDILRYVRRKPRWWEAVAENESNLREYTERIMHSDLMSYREQHLMPADKLLQSQHVVRVVLETTGRHIPAVYWLSRAFRCHPQRQRDYWECALRCALRLLDVAEREFISWRVDLPQKAAVICTAAALFTNAGVVYVNDHVNRARRTDSLLKRRTVNGDGGGDNIVDIERFMDPVVVRAADCEDSSSLCYWLLKFLHQAPNSDISMSPLLAEAVRCVSTIYVPVAFICEGVRPDAPERLRIDEYTDEEMLGHFAAALVPASFIAVSMRRAGFESILTERHVIDPTLAPLAQPIIAEGTIFQLGLVNAYRDYVLGDAAAAAADTTRTATPPTPPTPPTRDTVVARLEETQRLAARCIQRVSSFSACVQDWKTFIPIASGTPFYGRIIKMMSNVMHDRVWSLAVTYDNGVYGVTMQDFVNQRPNVVMRELTLQDADIGKVANDALAQCHPVRVPLPGNGADFAVTDERLQALMPLMSAATRQALLALSNAVRDNNRDDDDGGADASRFFVNQCQWHRNLWSLDLPPTELDIVTMRRALVNGVYSAVRMQLLHVSGGIHLSGNVDDDEICTKPVGVLVVKLRLPH